MKKLLIKNIGILATPLGSSARGGEAQEIGRAHV